MLIKNSSAWLFKMDASMSVVVVGPVISILYLWKMPVDAGLALED